VKAILELVRRLKIPYEFAFDLRQTDPRREQIQVLNSCLEDRILENQRVVCEDFVDRQLDVSRIQKGNGAVRLGSRSARRTRFPLRANAAARLMAVVVFPTPPF
jgi:hypothetical protein